MSPSVQRLGGTALATLLSALVAAPVRPCAPAPPPGTHVSILAEQALIVWDPATRRQHFIRRASFESSAADFGFLVPTPTPPELSEAPDAVFDRLREAIQPEVVRRTGLRPVPFALILLPFLWLDRSAPMEGAGMPVTAGAPPPAQVRVLEEKRVAGYDAAVLQADDAPALMRWLADHKYDARPELRDWLRPYVEQRWTVTAFKVAGAGGGASVSTQAVGMSFAAERPFFPYREPADQRTRPAVSRAAPAATEPWRAAPGVFVAPAPEPGRELVVYLVAPGRMAGTIGPSRDWPAHVTWAAPRAGLEAIVAPALPAGTALPAGAWLNAFVDTSSPRPGVDDLFFAPERTQQTVIPPPIVLDERTDLPLPVDVALGLLAGGWWWRRRRARRAKTAPA